MRHVKISYMVNAPTLLVGLLVGLLMGCPESGGPLSTDADLGVRLQNDMSVGGSMNRPDQQLFQTRQLSINCTDAYESCNAQQARISVQTDSEFRLSVLLTENGRPEAGTLVTFAFVDTMGTDIQGLNVEDTELQVRSVATNDRGMADAILMTGLIETDLNIRAFIPGVGQIEWAIEVRRQRVGRMEVETEYQPGSQNRGGSSFDSVKVYLLPDTFSEAGCQDISTDPSALTIHAIREETGIFEVSAEKFESLVVFDGTDSENTYLAIAVVVNRDGDPIGFGCLAGLYVEPEDTARFKVVIQDIIIPLDYKGQYRVHMEIDLSDILHSDISMLSSDDQERLTFLSIFQQFRRDLYDFKTGVRQREQIMMNIFCNYVPFDGEQCSQIESYIVRGLLGPLIEDVIVQDAPQFLDALETLADVYFLLDRIQVEAVMNIRNQNPDSFGFLTQNELRINSLRFGRGSQCDGRTGSTDNCEYRTFDTEVVHVDKLGRFIPLSVGFDATTDGASLSLLYHEMEIHFGLILTRLLELWVYPLTLGVSTEGTLLQALDLALPCTPVDQFVGDDPFCLPFLLTNFEYVVREMFARLNFGGRRLGFSGQVDIRDDGGDRIVDRLLDGVLTVHLPEIIRDDDTNPNAGQPTAMEIEALRQARQTDLIGICFSACRCLTDLCDCVPDRCEL